jgi:hypothetical protein
MNINPFIQTAFGAIIGGFVVIATSWFNTMREKRKEIQSWYEQRYVTEGIDPLLAYLTNLSFRFLRLPKDDIILLPELSVPIEALTRIEVLLGINGGMEFLSVFIAKIYDSLSSEEYQDSAINPLFELCRLFYQLRQEVLRLIPRDINHKNQQLGITQFSDSIKLHILEYIGLTDELVYKQRPII